MFSPTLHIRPTNIRGHSVRYLCRHASENASRKKQIRIKVATCAAASIVASGLVLYKESTQLHRQFHVTSNVFDTERQSSYIYLVESDEVVHSQQKHKGGDKTVWFPRLQSHILSYDPWSLLSLTRSQEHGARLLGVQALADQHHWTDAQYRMIAQALDHPTLVGLARSPSVDLRFFLHMPKLKPPQRELHYELQVLLSSLSTDDLDKCTEFLSARALKTRQSQQDQSRELVFDSNGQQQEQPMKSVPSLSRIEMYSIQALLGHSKLASHCREIVQVGGLAVLQRLYELRGDRKPLVHTLARILANLSLCEDLRDDIIRGGWVSVFVTWMRSTDLALVLLATKSLAHLDQDFKERKYVDGVYLYHPQYRNREPLRADVVFVHGLMGGPFKTWRQKDRKKTGPNSTGSNGDREKERRNDNGDGENDKNERRNNNSREDVVVETTDADSEDVYTHCWPKDWLAQDVPATRMVSVEYETHISGWAVKCPVDTQRRTLLTRSREMLKSLREAGVGDRPVVWVGHSMGGLLIKQMLVLAREDPDSQSIVDNTRGIVFYSVPNKGTPLANTKRAFKYIISPTVEVEELKQYSKPLLALHKEFQQLVRTADTPVLSFGEGTQVKLPLRYKTIMVPRDSSDPGVGKFFLMANLNHLDICKPHCRNSELYHMTKEFIRSCVEHPGSIHSLTARDDEGLARGRSG